MDLELSDEQRLLKDSVDGLTARRYPDVKTRVAMMKEPKGYSAAGWKEWADQGLLAIPFAEADGGLGQGAGVAGLDQRARPARAHEIAGARQLDDPHTFGGAGLGRGVVDEDGDVRVGPVQFLQDRKSTRLNSSHRT